MKLQTIGRNEIIHFGSCSYLPHGKRCACRPVDYDYFTTPEEAAVFAAEVRGEILRTSPGEPGKGGIWRVTYPTRTLPLTKIYIPKGTIVAYHRNGRTKGTVEVETVTLIGDVYVDAARHDDGCWGYMVGRDCYSCAGGCATILGEA